MRNWLWMFPMKGAGYSFCRLSGLSRIWLQPSVCVQMSWRTTCFHGVYMFIMKEQDYFTLKNKRTKMDSCLLPHVPTAIRRPHGLWLPVLSVVLGGAHWCLIPWNCSDGGNGGKIRHAYSWRPRSPANTEPRQSWGSDSIAHCRLSLKPSSDSPEDCFRPHPCPPP